MVVSAAEIEAGLAAEDTIGHVHGLGLEPEDAADSAAILDWALRWHWRLRHWCSRMHTPRNALRMLGVVVKLVVELARATPHSTVDLEPGLAPPLCLSMTRTNRAGACHAIFAMRTASATSAECSSYLRIPSTSLFVHIPCQSSGSRGWVDGLYRRKDNYELIYKKAAASRLGMCTAVLPWISCDLQRSLATFSIDFSTRISRPFVPLCFEVSASPSRRARPYTATHPSTDVPFLDLSSSDTSQKQDPPQKMCGHGAPPLHDTSTARSSSPSTSTSVLLSTSQLVRHPTRPPSSPGSTTSCPQFLRHKAYLASPKSLSSPSHSCTPLKPNVLVQHIGFNLGLNCAESELRAGELGGDGDGPAVLRFCASPLPPARKGMPKQYSCHTISGSLASFACSSDLWRFEGAECETMTKTSKTKTATTSWLRIPSTLHPRCPPRLRTTHINPESSCPVAKPSIPPSSPCSNPTATASRPASSPPPTYPSSVGLWREDVSDELFNIRMSSGMSDVSLVAVVRKSGLNVERVAEDADATPAEEGQPTSGIASTIADRRNATAVPADAFACAVIGVLCVTQATTTTQRNARSRRPIHINITISTSHTVSYMLPNHNINHPSKYNINTPQMSNGRISTLGIDGAAESAKAYEGTGSFMEGRDGRWRCGRWRWEACEGTELATCAFCATVVTTGTTKPSNSTSNGAKAADSNAAKMAAIAPAPAPAPAVQTKQAPTPIATHVQATPTTTQVQTQQVSTQVARGQASTTAQGRAQVSDGLLQARAASQAQQQRYQVYASQYAA
ncbi:hypothetical protein M422DRAFT_254202 [Sphaerobolus stellatus SS14]|uniref:Uncharacterized protein n=1 Tax=Sphaerobolus stellatus (strain SS14) TaxID=990650 RepID=A0A0C9V6Y6_SPHS4|nr:hypothetical protein M422DRAFT_254202 [Sphaerobolus stellatus SS14]